MTRLVKSVFIPKPAAEVYEAWRRYDGFSPFTRLVKSDESPSLRDDLHVIEDIPGTRIVWETASGLGHRDGFVEFIPAEGGCVVVVVLNHKPMAGFAGAVCAKILDYPRIQVEEDISRFCSFITPEEEVVAKPASVQTQRRLGFFGVGSR